MNKKMNINKKTTNCFNSVDFGRFLTSHISSEDNATSFLSKDAAVSSSTSDSVFRSKEHFSGLYPDNEWTWPPLSLKTSPKSTQEVAENEKKDFDSSFLKSQEDMSKLLNSNWEAALSPQDVLATAKVLAQTNVKASSSNDNIAMEIPAKTPFADAFKSQDWAIGDDSIADIRFSPDMFDREDPVPAPVLSKSKKRKMSDVFSSREWVMAEILGDDMDSDATPVETLDGLLSDTESEWNAFLSSQVAKTPITESKKSIKKTKKRRRKKRKKVLPERKEYVDTISDLDVLLGRGGKTNHHPGNKRYREEVMNFRALYAGLKTDIEKTEMSMMLVDSIEKSGGRFLEEDKIKGGNGWISLGWYVVPKIVARRKASQALREDNDPEKRRAKRARFLAKKARLATN